MDIDSDLSEASPIPKSRSRSRSPEKPRSLTPERDVMSRASTQHGEVQMQSPQKSPSKSRLEVTFHREEDEVCIRMTGNGVHTRNGVFKSDIASQTSSVGK